jgi:hypothetical protein
MVGAGDRSGSTLDPTSQPRNLLTMVEQGFGLTITSVIYRPDIALIPLHRRGRRRPL